MSDYEVTWTRPACDIWETKAGREIFADVPGSRRQDLGIHLDGDELVVATRPPEGAGVDGGAVPRYRRTFNVPPGTDREAVRAQLKDGVLHLTLPARGPADTRTIEIEE